MLKLINEFSKGAEYKISVEKSVAEREIKTTIPFTTAPKIMKYLGINLVKEVKELHSENYETVKHS